MMQHLADNDYKRSKCQKLLLFSSLADEISTPAGPSVSVTMQRSPATVLTGRLSGLSFLCKWMQRSICSGLIPSKNINRHHIFRGKWSLLWIV